jgi:excisionase family DNA binding protein
MEDDLGVREAADLLGVSTRTLRTYLKAGRLPGAKHFEGKFGPEYRIPRSEVDSLRDELTAQGVNLQGVTPGEAADEPDSALDADRPSQAEQSADGEMMIPLTAIVASYQRAVREVGRLQHQLKQLKREVAQLREELMDRETLLAVMQEKKSGV